MESQAGWPLLGESQAFCSPSPLYLWGSHCCGPRSELRAVGPFTYSVSIIARRAFPGQKTRYQEGVEHLGSAKEAAGIPPQSYAPRVLAPAPTEVLPRDLGFKGYLFVPCGLVLFGLRQCAAALLSRLAWTLLRNPGCPQTLSPPPSLSQGLRL